MPQFLRLARAQAMSVKNREYVLAAQAVGASDMRIIVRHIIPNSAAPLLVQLMLVASYAILGEAFLSYLGVGVAPPTPSWGVMLREGVERMYSSAYLAIIPGLAITWLVLSLNILGDGLRDLLDPYFQGQL